MVDVTPGYDGSIDGSRFASLQTCSTSAGMRLRVEISHPPVRSFSGRRGSLDGGVAGCSRPRRCGGGGGVRRCVWRGRCSCRTMCDAGEQPLPLGGAAGEGGAGSGARPPCPAQVRRGAGRRPGRATDRPFPGSPRRHPPRGSPATAGSGLHAQLLQFGAQRGDLGFREVGALRRGPRQPARRRGNRSASRCRMFDDLALTTPLAAPKDSSREHRHRQPNCRYGILERLARSRRRPSGRGGWVAGSAPSRIPATGRRFPLACWIRPRRRTPLPHKVTTAPGCPGRPRPDTPHTPRPWNRRPPDATAGPTATPPGETRPTRSTSAIKISVTAQSRNRVGDVDPYEPSFRGSLRG